MSPDPRARLDALPAEYQRRIDGIRADLQHREQPVSADFAEQVTEGENDDVLRSLLLEAESELARVQSALQRLARGEYGRCVRCGAGIAPARLQALPQADTCTDCAA